MTPIRLLRRRTEAVLTWYRSAWRHRRMSWQRRGSGQSASSPWPTPSNQRLRFLQLFEAIGRGSSIVGKKWGV